MTVEPIGIIIILVGLYGLYKPPAFLIYAFLTSTLLAAAAAFNVSAIGGMSIQPAHVLFGFLLLKFLSSREIVQKTLEAAQFGRPGFWLMLTVILSIVTAYFMPRLFQGETFVFPVRAQAVGMSPLEPSTTNITQSAYFIADASCFLLLSGFGATRGGIRTMLHATLFVATANLAFAALDWITYLTHTSELLSVIRNANYILRADDEVAGFKRTVGSFVEASSFGGVTVGYFAFTIRLWFMGIYPRYTAALTVLALIAALLATSTTAYFGLAVFLPLLYVEFLFHTMSRPVSSPVKLFVFGAPFLVAILVLCVALSDSYSTRAHDLLDMFFFNKMSSDSGVERSSWNHAAMQSFFDTYGFGFGNGSGRASSFIVAVIASLGIVGSGLLFLFFVGVFFGRSSAIQPGSLEDAARKGGKSMCLALIIGGCASAPLIDLGLGFYAYAALACAVGFHAKSENFRLLKQATESGYFREPVRSSSF
jgi:hypothetical protein